MQEASLVEADERSPKLRAALVATVIRQPIAHSALVIGVISWEIDFEAPSSARAPEEKAVSIGQSGSDHLETLSR
jgi:hypothetical protein